MAPEEIKEQTIQSLANMLRTHPFSVEFVVKKKPAGIKIIYEVTKEYMDAMMKKAASRK